MNLSVHTLVEIYWFPSTRLVRIATQGDSLIMINPTQEFLINRYGRDKYTLLLVLLPMGNRLARADIAAALHHQWCYGHLPLRAATREEINSLHGLYGTFRMPSKLSQVPCLFTRFLMHSAWTSTQSMSLIQSHLRIASSLLMGLNARTGRVSQR